jgi:Flp pilus assembly protein TadD
MALAAVVVLALSPARAQTWRTAIDGQVRVAGSGSLPSDVTVRLEAAEGTYLSQQYVGTSGRFRFDGLERGLYRIVVTAEGFQTVSQEVDMSWEASKNPVIFLVPVVKKKLVPDPADTPTTTDLAAPKNARKAFEKGARALHAGRPGEATDHLAKAVAEYDCYARAHTALGVAHSMARRFDAAESAFRKAIQCDGGFLEPHLQLAVLLNAVRRYRECDKTLQQALRRFPSEWRFYYQLGIAGDGAGEYAKAEQHFLKAQEINPDVPPEFHLRLADVYVNWKKFDKARAEMEAYLRLEPNGQFAPATRQMLEHLETAGGPNPSDELAAPPQP